MDEDEWPEYWGWCNICEVDSRFKHMGLPGTPSLYACEVAGHERCIPLAREWNKALTDHSKEE